jgi:phosphatidylserine/phosphatidylglycerophosphate/cardiolipin synthase-like enzyme
MVDSLYRTERRQRARLLAQVRKRDLPSYEELDGADMWLVTAPKQTVGAILLHFAVDLGDRPKLWACTNATSMTELEELQKATRCQRFALDNIQLSRGPHMVAFIRKKMKGVVTKVHAKIAVLQAGERFVTIIGSANMTRNSGTEVVCISPDPELAEWAIEVIMSLEEAKKRG